MFKTLLVEDSFIFKELYRSSLKLQFPSMKIADARDGVEAFKRLASFHPHLIFMDIRLPGENGIELTKKIKSGHPEVVVAILTNYDFDEYREAALKNGADYFLVKGSVTPIDISALVKKILFEKGFKADGSKVAAA